MTESRERIERDSEQRKRVRRMGNGETGKEDMAEGNRDRIKKIYRLIRKRKGRD